MTDYVSIFAATVTIVAAYAVIRAYGAVFRPVKDDCHSWFAHGISMGFVAIAANAFYWGMVVRGLRIGGFTDLAATMWDMGAYLDLVLKALLPGWAAYAHLKAKHLALSAKDQREWWVWEMILFPPGRKSVLRTWLRRVGPAAPAQIRTKGADK